MQALGRLLQKQEQKIQALPRRFLRPGGRERVGAGVVGLPIVVFALDTNAVVVGHVAGYCSYVFGKVVVVGVVRPSED